MNKNEFLIELVTNPKVAVAVAPLTAATGVTTFLEMIPNDIGKLATLVGIILSSVLIYTHLRKGRLEYRKLKLEVSILKQKEAIRQLP